MKSRPKMSYPRLLAASVVLVVMLAGAAIAKPMVSKSKQKKFPSFQTVTAAVEHRLRTSRNYRPGDLVSRGEAASIFDDLANLGWPVADRKDILNQFLADDDELVRAVRNPNHVQFMRHVGQVPNGYGYDRLDRLSRMEDGRIIVSRLMEEPGGWNFVDIMSETQEAPGMAQAFSMGAGGKDFTKPTGHLYTEAQFIARLKQSYDKAAQKKRP